MSSSASKSPINNAAWLTAPKTPLVVKSAPYTSPKAHELVIKNGAIAINPSDWLKPALGNMIYAWVKYPFILGTDTAGTVVEVGSSITRFKIGDRVVGHAIGVDEKINSSAEGTFQNFTVLREEMTSPIPDSLSFESACVIPLGLSTAACGLFQKDQLALQTPSIPPKPTNKTLLIWGGATSVGSNAIQLAVAAGYEVFTTSSPKNFAYVKSLGASRVFDYNSPTVIADLTAEFQGKTSAGALSIGRGAADACVEILGNCKGSRFIAMATYPVPSPPPESFLLLKTIYSFISWSIVHFVKSKRRAIGSKFIFATTLAYNGVGRMVYEDFLPQALAEGVFIAKPDPIVVGKGLEYIQAGLDLQKKGVSAKKVVISL